MKILLACGRVESSIVKFPTRYYYSVYIDGCIFVHVEINNFLQTK